MQLGVSQHCCNKEGVESRFRGALRSRQSFTTLNTKATEPKRVPETGAKANSWHHLSLTARKPHPPPYKNLPSRENLTNGWKPKVNDCKVSS